MHTKHVSTQQSRTNWRNYLALGAGLLIASSGSIAGATTVSGNIGPQAIEIDRNANLYPGDGNSKILNPGATADWVKDSATNSDVSDLTDSIATGIIPGVSGAAGGSGHWNGVRIVDGVAGNDQDIFLTGGKENDLSTWNIGPGSIGSSKYDITQAYLANNQNSLFFGMERRGNNGTTAFDFEFNQKAPVSSYLPTRTVGDVLFTFEMNGSSTSGSAVPHYFVWNGTQYVEKTGSAKPASLISSINASPVPAAPWGFVNSKGNWALGTLPVYSFAEAAVNLADAFPNFVPCNSSAYVQVRTRSSVTETSDLKDTTKNFRYIFGGPRPQAALGTNCLQQFTYTAAGSLDSTGGTNLSYSWDFKAPTGVTLSGTGVTGPDATGTYHSTLSNGAVTVSLPSGVDSATVTVKLTVVEGAGCTTSTTPATITVQRQLSATVTKTSADGSALTVLLTATATSGTSIQWQVLKGGVWTNISGATAGTLTYSGFEADTTPVATSFSIGSGNAAGNYQGKLYLVSLRAHVTRTVDGVSCEADSAAVVVKKVTAVDP